MAEVSSNEPPCDKVDLSGVTAVGPVPRPWREGTLTRATELQALCNWVLAKRCPPNSPPGNMPEDLHALVEAIKTHLKAATDAAEGKKPPKLERTSKWFLLFHWSYWFRTASLIQRGLSNLDAAETLLLNFAPPDYLLGQMPGLLHHVQRHLPPTDPRRQALERIAQRLGVKDPDHPLIDKSKELSSTETEELIIVRRIAWKLRAVDRTPPPQVDGPEQIISQERGKIVTAFRGASSEALREQLRLRSFRNILTATIIGLTLLAISMAIFGWFFPMRVPLCFQPSLESGETVIVCPTAISNRIPPEAQPGPVLIYRISEAVRPWDHLTVELVGLTGAAIVATIRIRRIRGSSEAPDLPLLLALLKLPVGAITAVLGLLLVRGQFIPGLSALDTPAQILSWALVFGFAQQLFTRLVDQQGQTVLNSVRAPDRPPTNEPTNEPSPQRP
jgi:hypothetical protein